MYSLLSLSSSLNLFESFNYNYPRQITFSAWFAGNSLPRCWLLFGSKYIQTLGYTFSFFSIDLPRCTGGWYPVHDTPKPRTATRTGVRRKQDDIQPHLLRFFSFVRHLFNIQKSHPLPGLSFFFFPILTHPVHLFPRRKRERGGKTRI